MAQHSFPILWDSQRKVCTTPGSCTTLEWFSGESRHGTLYHAGGWFLFVGATQLAPPLQQRRIQVVRSNKVARKRLTESNCTPAMDFGCEEIRKRRYTQTKNRTQYTNTIVI